MASVPYVRLNGVSLVEVCGVHLYAHNILWQIHGALLGFVKDGAKAMDVYVQDPPRSYGDLEGA